MTETAVVTAEPRAIATSNLSPMAAMEMALTHGADLDKLERMLELQEKYEAMEARKAYNQAMAAFKADPPRIIKDKKVSYKNTNYSHASLGNVTETINSSLAKHGLSASWKPDQTDGSVKVTCTITHKLGHSESASLTASTDTSGSKNSIQALGSTITYLSRYTLLALTGLGTHDDDDGESSEIRFLDEKQVSTVTDMMNELIQDHGDFLGYIGQNIKPVMKIMTIEQIPAKDYGFVISTLKKIQEQSGGAA